MTYWLYLTVGWPTLIQGYVIGLFSLMFGLTRKPRFDGPVLATDWRPWVEKRYNFTTTIGAWQGRASWFNETTRYHEAVHLRQYIDLNTIGAILGAALIPWIGWQGALILWATSGAPWLLPLFVTAVIRYKRGGVSWMDAAYMGTEHELSAYAQTALRFRV